MFSRPYTAAICIILFPILNLSASYKDEVHYNQLVNELSLRGISVPTGAGVSVTQVEAREDTNGNGILQSYEGYTPNPSSSEFSGKTLTDVSNLDRILQIMEHGSVAISTVTHPLSLRNHKCFSL